MTGLRPQFDVPSFECVGLGDDAKQFFFKLSDYKDSFVLFLFFPFDPVEVCEKEVEDFSKSCGEFWNKNCSVYGISVLSLDELAEWTSQTSVRRKFPFLADPDLRIANMLNAVNRSKNATLRCQVLIDYRGVVRYAEVVDNRIQRSVRSALRVLDNVQKVDTIIGLYNGGR